MSPKAIDVSTAAYMFKLLIRKSPHEITLGVKNTEQQRKESDTRPHGESNSAVGEKSDNERKENIEIEEGEESMTELTEKPDAEEREKTGNEQDEQSRDLSRNLDQPNDTNKRTNELKDIGFQCSMMSLSTGFEATSVPKGQNFVVLSHLLEVLQSQINVARKSLLKAASEAPIHGVLYCIREILCDFELR